MRRFLALAILTLASCSGPTGGDGPGATAVLWLENDTPFVISIGGTGTVHVLAPGDALDVATMAAPGDDEFRGSVDGVLFTFTINTGEIDEYEEPNAPGHYRVPLSEFIPATSLLTP